MRSGDGVRAVKKGNLQVNYGLLTHGAGIPESVSVFEGNAGDPKTLLPAVRRVREQFGVAEFTIVGEGGMITQTRIEESRLPNRNAPCRIAPYRASPGNGAL